MGDDKLSYLTMRVRAMFVKKVNGRQLARCIAYFYFILWILFIIFMISRFGLNVYLDIDLLIPLIVTTVIDISLAFIIYVSSYRIENDNHLCILYGIICVLSVLWYFNWFGLIFLVLFILAIFIIKFGQDT